MNGDNFQEIASRLSHEYLLIRKSRFWYLLGGVIAFMSVAGIISYSSAKSALESQPAKQVVAKMYDYSAEAKAILEEMQAQTIRYSEIDLSAVGVWKEILDLSPQSAIKIEAYTSENNYIQPFTAYLWRPYEGQDAAMKFSPVHPQLHTHSNAVEWQMLPNGTLRIRPVDFDSGRRFGITSIKVLRGKYRVLAEELKGQ